MGFHNPVIFRWKEVSIMAEADGRRPAGRKWSRSRLRFVALASLAALCLQWLPAIAVAQTALDQARELYKRLDFEGALGIVNPAIRTAESPEAKAKLYEVKGCAALALGREEEAEQAVARMYRITADYEVALDESPKVVEFFKRVRRETLGEGLSGIRLAPNLGGLRVVTQPEGATVWVDGKEKRAKTPCTIGGLKAGRHKVVVKLKGYSTVKCKISVRPGGLAPLEIRLKESTGWKPLWFVAGALVVGGVIAIAASGGDGGGSLAGDGPPPPPGG